MQIQGRKTMQHIDVNTQYRRSHKKNQYKKSYHKNIKKLAKSA